MRKCINQPHCFPVFSIKKWSVICFVILFGIIHGSCKKDNQTDVVVPVVITGEIYEINQQSATCKGQVTSEGSASVSAKGICSNTSGMPTISDQKTIDGPGTESFTHYLMELEPNTLYYIRAYATSKAGTGYGEEKSFRTLAPANQMARVEIKNIVEGETSISVEVELISEYTKEFKWGVCWNTSGNPDVSDFYTQEKSNAGTYTVQLSPVESNTLYYIAAFVEVEDEMNYSPVAQRKTLTDIAVITSDVSNISYNSGVCGGEVDADVAIDQRGVCWNTTGEPTVQDEKVLNGTGNGSFLVTMSGLASGTKYYVRAFATATGGIKTVYGEEKTFTTLAGTLPTVTTADIAGITQIAATGGGAVTFDGGVSIIESGLCWSTGSTPTINDNKTTDGLTSGDFTSKMTGLSAGTKYYVRTYARNSMGVGYGNIKAFNTVGLTVKDKDNNIYDIITIGDQVWMKQNLKTTKYNDGGNIPEVTSDTQWENQGIPAYCWYNNSKATYANTYGAMYNFYAVETGKLCPTGWHVPSETDIEIFLNYIGGKGIAGGKLKETGTSHWQSPNKGATNELGFNGLPGGWRDIDSFSRLGLYSRWWTSTENNSSNDRAITFQMHYDAIVVTFPQINNPKNMGNYIRCLMD